MNDLINIYCDESCHLKKDKNDAMLLGAISCPANSKATINQDIRNLKKKHNLSTWTEIKWTGVSNSKINFYLDLVDYFVNNQNLNFRSVVIKNKYNLNHKLYNSGDHDVWYYKMYFYLLDPMISYEYKYKIMIDIKDTLGGPKVKKLEQVLCNNIYDFKHEVIKGIYQVRSHECEILQLTDLIMGAIGYFHNGHHKVSGSSNAKNTIVDRLFMYYERQIKFGTSRNAEKMNIFLWEL